MNLIPAATILLIENGLVLSVSRKDNYNSWGLPGGKCEANESFSDAALRELLEEANLYGEDPEFVFERQNNRYFVKTFRITKYKGRIFSYEECIERKEGLVKFAKPQELIEGKYGEYNKILFQKVGLI